MYNDVSLRLRNKIRRDMIIATDLYDGKGRGILQFHDDENELFDECLLWIKIINSYFKTSYNCYRLTRVGRFIDIRPVQVIGERKVEFDVDNYHPPSLKDWFVDNDGSDDGVLLGSLGTVINQRTFPQYYKDGKYIFAKENN